MGTTTAILGIYKPAISETGWGLLRNASYDTLDTAIGTQHGIAGNHTFITVSNSTGFIRFPSLTTVERDALTATNGDTIYNSTTSTLQTYEAGAWGGVTSNLITVRETDSDPSVASTNEIIFPNGTLTDTGGGSVTVSGFLLDADGVASGDMPWFDGANWAIISPGLAGYILQANGVGNTPTWVLPATGGNVSSTLTISDHALVRGDGGTLNVQETGILIDDSDNISGIGTITADGPLTINLVEIVGVDGEVNKAAVEDSGNWDAASAHVTADGSSHTFIDQSVVSGASPTFDGNNFTGIDANDVDIADAGALITATDTEGALQENRTAINLNTSKTTNATHTGDVTGSGALTVDPTAITGKGVATVAAGDLVLIADVNDSNNLKQVTASSIGALGGGTALEVEDETVSLSTAVTKINFAGAGVTATEPVADEILVTIPGGGGGATLTESIAQATHGFSVNEWVYHNGTQYALADASAASTAESIGIVETVTDANNFDIQFGGRITGLSGLTAGEAHFLSETAGAITATAPSTIGAVIKPVLVADSTTSGFIFNMRGSEINDTGASFLQSFVDGDLTAGVLTATHNLGQQYVQVQVFDNNDQLLMPDDVTLTSTNVSTIDLTSFGTIVGTWSIVVLSSGSTSSISATPSFTNITVTGTAPSTPAVDTIYKENIVKSYINFNGNGTIAIRDSFNVTSITDIGVGNYSVTWETDFADANYTATLGGDFYHQTLTTHAVGSLGLNVYNASHTLGDSAYISVIAIGNQ